MNCFSTPYDFAVRPYTVNELVAACLARRNFFLDLHHQFGSPLYVIEEAILLARVREFTEAFRAYLPDLQAYFPVKANSHPRVLAAVIKAGMGAEVGSGLELRKAVAAGAKAILFNGPAKTEAELNLALQYRELVTIILDSENELARLETLAEESETKIRAGVRLAVETQGLWRKFGIQLAELPRFLERAKRCRQVRLNGLHFHTSWNMDPTAPVETLLRLEKVLQELSPEMKQGLTFIDIGGGFWPPQGEWLPTPCLTKPIIKDEASIAYNKTPLADPSPFFTTVPATPIAEFARQLSDALKSSVFRHFPCQVYTEPGRWICSDAAQILLTVLDRKGEDIAITDGGTNMVGWEQFEHEYFPLINLSQPALMERPCLVLGSLCTPRDLWGRSYFGSNIQCGDRLLIPNQGAYTYSLRQAFIKPLPRSVFIPAGGEMTAERTPTA